MNAREVGLTVSLAAVDYPVIFNQRRNIKKKRNKFVDNYNNVSLS